jgi:SulP family sulfate permease
MARLVEVTSGAGLSDSAMRETPLEPGNEDIIIYRVSGPLFFGSTPRFGDVTSRIGIRPRGFILDLSGVPLIDASGAEALIAFDRMARSNGARVVLCGVRADNRRAVSHVPDLLFTDTVADAEDYLRRSMP